MFKAPPGIRYADFTEEEKEQARVSNSLLFISPMVSRHCNLKCRNCYAQGGEKVCHDLSKEKMKQIIQEGKSLGARTARFAGLGEPLLRPDIFELIAYANAQGLGVFMFTNGTLISREIARRLLALRVSVVCKFWSLNPDVFEALTGNQGYFQKENWVKDQGFKVPRGLGNLLAVGFGQQGTPSRLGIELLMHRQNQDSYIPIYRWCREHNIVPYYEIIMHSGRAKNRARKKTNSLTKEEAQCWFQRLLALDQKEFGISWFPLPPYVGWPCDKLFYNLCVLPKGDVLACYATYPVLGNIYAQSLQEIIESPILAKLRAGKKYLVGKCQSCEIRECKIGGCRCDACAHGNTFGEYEMCWYEDQYFRPF